jgi:hypothetical protein
VGDSNLCNLAICLFNVANFLQVCTSVHNGVSQVGELSIQMAARR